jgi:hypothetical protein
MTRTIVRALVVLLLAVGLGFLGGWLWWHWWGPATKGTVYDTAQGPHWYDASADGLKREFSATAEYVLVTAGLGIVLGLVCGLLARGRELLFVGLLVVGAAGAAVLTAWFGSELGPPVPPATHANIGKEFLGHLSVSGWSPYLAGPVGALAGFLVVLLSVHSMSGVPQLSSETSESEQPRSPAAS